MPDAQGIAAYVQRRLGQLGIDEVTAVEAAVWLDDTGLLKDSPTRPGQPLRKLLRAGGIPQAEQRPPRSSGTWVIVREESRTAARRSSRSSEQTAHPGYNVGVSTGDAGGLEPGNLQAVTEDRQEVAERSVAQSGNRRTDTFTRAELVVRGFVGFERFKDINLDRVPRSPGVYAVLREKDSRPAFLDRSPAGWFKGRNPTVPVAELDAAWPDGAHCVYIGKAGSGTRGRRGLRTRISEFRQYADGRAIGHEGGRRIWQLADADEYILAWRPTPGADPGAIEAELIGAFVAEYGKRPLGNRTSGQSS